MKKERIQPKDIPDRPVLEFLRDLEGSGTWFDYEPRPDNTVVRAMPEGISEKLVRTKMSGLLRRGLVSGCGCGCRGDFEITDKRREMLAASVALKAVA